MSQFKIHKPGGGRAGFVKDDHEDHLIAFMGITYEASVSTAYGDSDAARVETLLCLDHPMVLNDVMVFGTALVPRLTDNDEEGGITLGRLVKGEAKPGRSAPWLLEDPSEEDMEQCEKFLDANATTLRSGRVMIELPEDEKF